MNITRRNILASSAVASAALLGRVPALANSSPAISSDVGVQWVTLSNGHRVWTQKLGKGPKKVLLLHGGPGFSHDYMDCFSDFLPQAGYEMYFYDQLGCGKSDRPEDTSLWTLPRYLEEVEEVRQALGLDRFILVGHSWGGILGIEYALKYGAHLEGFVLSSMTASFADFAAYTETLKGTLPPAIRDQLATLEKAGKADSDEYGSILQRELYTRYICRLSPWPSGLQHSFDVANGTIYNQMQGPNEFVITGNLKGWDRWSDLPRITTPTLVMGARYDEMNPKSIEREANLIPHAQLFMSENGSHLAMWDDQKNYFHALLAFLHGL
ncbi:proline iminopeptidase-family hydrolase [Novosphingobium sp.]|uniref:proline iminopeptidase-family hydrolase n=1 Tax=Novosphingobium sp. TaxID=1874826 RepID=UPI0031D737DD